MSAETEQSTSEFDLCEINIQSEWLSFMTGSSSGYGKFRKDKSLIIYRWVSTAAWVVFWSLVLWRMWWALTSCKWRHYRALHGNFVVFKCTSNKSEIYPETKKENVDFCLFECICRAWLMIRDQTRSIRKESVNQSFLTSVCMSINIYSYIYSVYR